MGLAVARCVSVRMEGVAIMPVDTVTVCRAGVEHFAMNPVKRIATARTVHTTAPAPAQHYRVRGPLATAFALLGILEGRKSYISCV